MPINNTMDDIFSRILPQKNNQIFTPKSIVKKQLDILEQEVGVENLWCDPNKTFVDFYVKSGQYLAEIVTRLYHYLEPIIPDDDSRIEHILEHQVYGFAPEEILRAVSSRYLFMFSERSDWHGKQLNKSHIINYDWTDMFKAGDMKVVNDKLLSMYTANDYKYLVKDGDDKVKFDVVVGNPPYQEDNNGHKTQVHQDFLLMSTLFGHYISLIQPLNWLDNTKLVNSIKSHVIILRRYSDSSTLFDSVIIPSGVGITVINMDRVVSTTKILENEIVSIAELKGNFNLSDIRLINEMEPKLKASLSTTFSDYIAYNGSDKSIKIDNTGDIEMWFKLESGKSGRNSWFTVNRKDIPDDPIIDKYKIMVSGAGNASMTETHAQNIINNKTMILPPGYISSGANLLIPVEDEQAGNLLASYLDTRFVRRLVHILAKGTHVRKFMFRYVPDITEWQDSYEADLSAGKLTDSVDDLDEWLWKYYKLSEETIADIKKRISKK